VAADRKFDFVEILHHFCDFVRLQIPHWGPIDFQQLVAALKRMRLKKKKLVAALKRMRLRKKKTRSLKEIRERQMKLDENGQMKLIVFIMKLRIFHIFARKWRCFRFSSNFNQKI
jgi:hypothetical protein